MSGFAVWRIARTEHKRHPDSAAQWEPVSRHERYPEALGACYPLGEGEPWIYRVLRDWEEPEVMRGEWTRDKEMDEQQQSLSLLWEDEEEEANAVSGRLRVGGRVLLPARQVGE